MAFEQFIHVNQIAFGPIGAGLPHIRGVKRALLFTFALSRRAQLLARDDQADDQRERDER
jgi:hypothetical protein